MLLFCLLSDAQSFGSSCLHFFPDDYFCLFPSFFCRLLLSAFNLCVGEVSLIPAGLTAYYDFWLAVD